MKSSACGLGWGYWFCLASAGAEKMLEALCAQGADVNARNSNDEEVLLVAVLNFQQDFVRELVNTYNVYTTLIDLQSILK